METRTMRQDKITPLPKGHRLEEYEIGAVLGHGSFGITYLARDVNLGLQYAIKEYMPNDLAMRTESSTVCPRSEAHIPDFKWGCERFIEEAKLLALFKHPNIVEVRRYFSANGTAYLVMPYHEGESLGRLLKRQGKVTPERLKSIVVPLLNGIDDVHAVGMIHRDIKPDNIFMQRDGIPVLLDFGAARHALGNKTQTAATLVSPGYAPIEQYHGDGNFGPWTDIYALASVMYRAISGHTPPPAPARLEADEMQPLKDLAGTEWNRTLLRAVEHGLASRSRDRPQKACEWLSQLYGDEIGAVLVRPMPEVVPVAGGDDVAGNNVDTLTAGTPEGGGTMDSPGAGTMSGPRADELAAKALRDERSRAIRTGLVWAAGGFALALGIVGTLAASGAI